MHWIWYVCLVLTVTCDSANVHTVCPVGFTLGRQVQLRLRWQTHPATCQIQERLCSRRLFYCAHVKDSSRLWYIIIVLVLPVWLLLLADDVVYVRLSAFLSVCQSHYMSVYLIVYLSFCLCIFLSSSVSLSVCVRDCYYLLMMLFVCLLVCLHACLSVSLSVCLPSCICLFVWVTVITCHRCCVYSKTSVNCQYKPAAGCWRQRTIREGTLGRSSVVVITEVFVN